MKASRADGSGSSRGDGASTLVGGSGAQTRRRVIRLAGSVNAWTPRAQDVMKIVDGKLFGLPIRGQVSWLFLYWNRDMLKKAGIPEPTPNWTIDDLITNAKKLVQPGNNDFFPIVYGGNNGFE